MKRGEIQPVTKATERPAPIADADGKRRAALRAFQSGDAVSERVMEPVQVTESGDSVMMPLTSSEIEHIATASADAAVRKLFLTMGVDTSDDKAMLEMQRDFAHVRTWRKSVETVRRQTLLAAVGVIVSGILGAVYMAFSRGGH